MNSEVRVLDHWSIPLSLGQFEDIHTKSPSFQTNMGVPAHAAIDPKDLHQFEKDIKDVHLIYDYEAKDAHGNPEKWKYEMYSTLFIPLITSLTIQNRWYFSSDRIVYSIHGGPMAGRQNYQTASYQCIRPGELWQCNWLEGSCLPPLPNPEFLLTIAPAETGTVVSQVYDIPNRRITTLGSFSQGHWEHAEAAHGDKRNKEDFERWRSLAGIGKQTDRWMLNEQADILHVFKGRGELEPIAGDEETL